MRQTESEATWQWTVLDLKGIWRILAPSFSYPGNLLAWLHFAQCTIMLQSFLANSNSDSGPLTVFRPPPSACQHLLPPYVISVETGEKDGNYTSTGSLTKFTKSSCLTKCGRSSQLCLWRNKSAVHSCFVSQTCSLNSTPYIQDKLLFAYVCNCP